MTKVFTSILIVLLATPAGWAQTQSDSGREWASVLALSRSASLSIELKDGKTLKGRLDSVSADKLSITKDKSMTEINRNDVARLFKTSGSIPRSVGFGSVIGAGSGAAFGASVFDGRGWFDPGRGGGAAIFAVLGAGVGAITGLIVGVARRDRVEIYRGR